MAELLYTERLQPSLLDRLTDNNPDKQVESREQRVLSGRQLRQSVLRDLTWLLNTAALDSCVDLSELPDAEHSVINYGILTFSGAHLTGADLPKIERKIKQAIMDFEPRITPGSLKVEVISSEEHMNQHAMSFKIEGDLWAQPLPVHLYIRSELDLETGEATIKDLGG
ncbi:type VI secretion system baseplate subunit TssE [Methylomonas rapida]|jgi:type VI secretion system lysozyme-related protein|uniref:Type VI secretion system baseplate subunit TssE n=1 Tax=Methylomonas rapida TaxID=2963939 RepID=A0ABY7GI75_9GAMM|nr:type VI secretion system baseplate subunit TssE [Methylomonas rapida]WAR44226.1 type VI secretion system baseplate subunit TssE [Methylomonas rapida]